MHRFGAVAIDNPTRDMIQQWPLLDKTTLSPKQIAFGIDAYDECVADLDEQLGVLFDELRRRGILDQTWLIVVADHGESFGEHEGIFCHGMSLYQTEVHVPLLIVPPGGAAEARVVKETVSLRDLAATVVDLLGMTAGSPIPGDSLARLWQQSRPREKKDGNGVANAGALAEVVPLAASNGDPSALPRNDMAAGRSRRRRVVIRSSGNSGPRRAIRFERRPKGAKQPGGQSGGAGHARADAGATSEGDGGSADAVAIRPVRPRRPLARR